LDNAAARKIRVASVQYYIRPVDSFDQFRNQVEALVGTAADYGCHLVVFPEYFTVQLLTTLGETRRPVARQIRDLTAQVPRYVELFSELARRSSIYIVAGTIPTLDGDGDDEAVHNESYLFAPSGQHGVQGKLHITRWETEDWKVQPRERLRIFETSFGRIAINVCYDVEFPELARVAARRGASVLVVPSCTDDRQGFLRVRYCAQARAIENQLYVVHSSTVGSLPMVPAVSLNYGQASILTPSDFAFARDGILAEGLPNQESMVIGDLNLATILESREKGTVLPLRDSVRSEQVADSAEVVEL
jgi:predicted amidohydrolase